MIGKNKDRAAILQKMGIEKLNGMQEKALETISQHTETILLSPTGTGKTLAFLLPIIEALEPENGQTQVLILVPSRELAIQIEQVTREMGSGHKVNAVYGGRAGTKDKMELKHAPTILIGTPGRVADHFYRETIDSSSIHTLVFDEFDKSLEVGFENEMKEIMINLPSLRKKVLTSATQKISVPQFVGLKKPQRLNFLKDETPSLEVKTIISPTQDKLGTLAKLLGHVGNGRGIIFCNLKDTVAFVSNFLEEQNIDHACFYGGMEQQDRERALIKFRNGSHRILLATDLAARGIDVPEINFVIHYQMPFKLAEFVHRNGRTARMHRDGTAYILLWEERQLPEFIEDAPVQEIKAQQKIEPSEWTTLFISGGRKDKISKGDIAGLFFKQGELNKDELGIIELKHDCAFIAVPSAKAETLIDKLNNSRLKKKKVRVRLLD